MRRTLLLLLVSSSAAAEVKLGDAAQVVSDAAARVDRKTARSGETLAIDTVAPAEAIDTQPLRASIARLKLKILYETPTTMVLEAANGARARITFDRGGGAITLTARPATPALPGRCVPFPTAEHPVYVTTNDNRSLWEIKTERLHDVDGDGIPDVFVPVAKTPNACPEEITYRVFAVRGTCGHDLGVIGPGSFAFDAGTTALEHGFRPFTLEAQTARRGKRGIEMTTTTRRFVARRGKYAVVEATTRTAACDHCATWTCAAP